MTFDYTITQLDSGNIDVKKYKIDIIRITKGSIWPDTLYSYTRNSIDLGGGNWSPSYSNIESEVITLLHSDLFVNCTRIHYGFLSVSVTNYVLDTSRPAVPINSDILGAFVNSEPAKVSAFTVNGAGLDCNCPLTTQKHIYKYGYIIESKYIIYRYFLMHNGKLSAVCSHADDTMHNVSSCVFYDLVYTITSLPSKDTRTPTSCCLLYELEPKKYKKI